MNKIGKTSRNREGENAFLESRHHFNVMTSTPEKFPKVTTSGLKLQHSFQSRDILYRVATFFAELRHNVFNVVTFS